MEEAESHWEVGKEGIQQAASRSRSLVAKEVVEASLGRCQWEAEGP